MIVLLRWATGEKTQITALQSPWNWFAPSFSPDGEHVLFQLRRDGSETGRLDVWSVPLAGGTTSLAVPDATFPMYFPDGKTIAVVDPIASEYGGLSISIVRADGSRRRLVTTEEPVFDPSMSLDGSRIAYVDGKSIRVVDVATGESTSVAEGITVEWFGDDQLVIVPG